MKPDSRHIGNVLKRGQKVIVFNSRALDAGVADYGRVTEVDEASVQKYTFRPDRWKYVVYFPRLGCYHAIRARHLLAIDGPDSTERSVFEVCFDSGPTSDNLVIAGRYRVPGRRKWSSFRFTKTHNRVPSFRLAMPVTRRGVKPCRLLYSVPATERLDRDYVLKALGEICRDADWEDTSRENSSS